MCKMYGRVSRDSGKYNHVLVLEAECDYFVNNAVPPYFAQALTKYESTNARRLLTGILFGIGLASLFAESTIIVFEYGIEIGRTLKK